MIFIESSWIPFQHRDLTKGRRFLTPVCSPRNVDWSHQVSERNYVLQEKPRSLSKQIAKNCTTLPTELEYDSEFILKK